MDYKRELAANERLGILDFLTIQLIRIYNQIDDDKKQIQNNHWIDVALKDPLVLETLQMYRELEQVRFIDLYMDRIHPDLFDDFISVIDGIFDVRIPPLFTVLGYYSKYENRHKIEKAPEKAQEKVEEKQEIIDEKST